MLETGGILYQRFAYPSSMEIMGLEFSRRISGFVWVKKN